MGRVPPAAGNKQGLLGPQFELDRCSFGKERILGEVDPVEVWNLGEEWFVVLRIEIYAV